MARKHKAPPGNDQAWQNSVGTSNNYLLREYTLHGKANDMCMNYHQTVLIVTKDDVTGDLRMFSNDYSQFAFTPDSGVSVWQYGPEDVMTANEARASTFNRSRSSSSQQRCRSATPANGDSGEDWPFVASWAEAPRQQCQQDGPSLLSPPTSNPRHQRHDSGCSTSSGHWGADLGLSAPQYVDGLIPVESEKEPAATAAQAIVDAVEAITDCPQGSEVIKVDNSAPDWMKGIDDLIQSCGSDYMLDATLPMLPQTPLLLMDTPKEGTTIDTMKLW